jgi:hypothetical protein
MFGADARGLREQLGFAAAQLQRNGMFDRIHREQARAIAEHHRVGMHHLGVQARVRREHAVEHAAMRVRPVHHRGDGQAQLCGVDGGRRNHRPAILLRASRAPPRWPATGIRTNTPRRGARR